MKTWNIPSYHYGRDTTTGELLHQFLAHNEEDRPRLVKELGTSEEQVGRWLQSELTVGLTSRFKVPFEELTGIQLERLYVINTKLEILTMLGQFNALRRTKPGLARLLSLDLNLESKIDFDTITTRNEVLDGLKRLAERCGWSLVALQIGVEDGLVSKWAPKGTYRPSGEYLARAVIGLTIGLIATDPDDTRFQVCAQALLGPDFDRILGVHTLAQAASMLFQGHRDEPTSVLRNRTGLNESVVRSLLNYQPTGKRQFATMIGVIRALIAHQYQDRLGEFDSLAEAFMKNVEKGEITIEPLRLTQDREAPSMAVSPEPRSASRREAQPPVVEPSTPVRPPPSPPVRTPSDIDSGVRALAATLLAVRASIDGQLLGLQVQFTGLIPTPAMATPSAAPSQDIVERLAPDGRRLSPEDTEAIVLRFQQMVGLAQVICRLPEDQRGEILGRLDQLLVSLQQTLEAAGTKEPERYLEMLRGKRDARKVIGG